MEILDLFTHNEIAKQELRIELESPSLYDEFLRHLARRGHAVPEACLASGSSLTGVIRI
jgi:tryptophan 2,3-dioxygenase